MAVKECPKCGESNRENATSCVNCGTSLVKVDSTGVADNEKNIQAMLDRCPHCDKKLNGSPKKCPYCGNDLSSIKERRYYAVSHNSNDENNTGIFILSFLIPIIGIIIGAIWLASDNKKESGGTAIAISVVGMIVWALVFSSVL